MVRPRLTDAEFFFKQDKKQPLESFNERLRNVVFQAQLGTVFEKAQRVSGLAAYIAERIGGNAQNAARAGILSKCDLATEMVGEFPEMQGIAGYYYATHGGEAEDVALALNEQYMPRGAGAELPSTLTGAAVAVADKLDTLVGIFGIGMLPTGSKDPYALRRAALGVLRILIEKQLDLDLVAAVNAAVEQYGDKVKAAGLAEQVLDFVFDRLRARYEDEGVDVAVYRRCARSSQARRWTSTSAYRPSRPSASCLKPRPWPRRTNGCRIFSPSPRMRFRRAWMPACWWKPPRRPWAAPWRTPKAKSRRWQRHATIAPRWPAWRPCASRWIRSSPM